MAPTAAEARAFLFSRRSVNVFKAFLAYVIAFILIFSKPFDKLSAFPAAYSGTILITIAGGPGKTVGECLQGIIFGLTGVGIGSFNFYILAKLGHAPAAQVPVFFFMVYVLALIKARGLQYFAFSLLAILMSFNGIYTSLMFGGHFSSVYLEEYIKSYAWGAAIVVFVNFLIFPVTSEKELRKTLVVSLQHISTLTHLIAKTYTLTITDEEKGVRDRLNQSIRADFGFLTQKINNTSLEINFSRWSMQDYASYVEKTRRLQLNLITVYSSLMGNQKEGIELFKTQFLPSTIGAFTQLRHDTQTTIDEIARGLSCEGLNIPTVGYQEFLDLERQTSESGDPQREHELREQLKIVGARLQAEAERQATSHGNGDQSPGPSTLSPRLGGADTDASASPTITSHPRPPFIETGTSSATPMPALRGCARALRKHFTAFRDKQIELLTGVLVSGDLHGGDETLRIRQPRPSTWDIFGEDTIGGKRSSGEVRKGGEEYDGLRMRNIGGKRKEGSSSEDDEKATEKKKKNGDSDDSSSDDEDHEPRTAAEKESRTNAGSIVRVFSFVYGLQQFVDTLERFHADIETHNAKKTGPFGGRRLHVHLFERLQRPHVPPSDKPASETQQEMSMKEALCLLEQKPYTPVKPNAWQRLADFENFLRSPDSIYALKTALAAVVYTTLLWAPKTRGWFVSYGLTGGVITVIVALSPTLGQSLLSFVLQISGSSVGYLWGMAVLEMFKNVGGHHFNPYGIVCMIALFAIPMEYIIYEKPQLFVFGLLALNGCGVVVVTEYVTVEYAKRLTFDSPPYRVGKALTALCVSLAIVACFQFLLRNPARRQVRKALARLTYANMSFHNIMAAYIRAMLSIDKSFRPSPEAIARIRHELRHREVKIQQQILAIMPLLTFAAAEPHLARPNKQETCVKIIRANQIILDRAREARDALGTEPFADFIIRELVVPLSPYRRRTIRFSKAMLYLCAASLDSKQPLPHDMPRTQDYLPDVWHDILLLSARLGQKPEGKEYVQSGEFTRYWFYLLSILSVGEQIEVIEKATKEMFGEMEDYPRLT